MQKEQLKDNIKMELKPQDSLRQQKQQIEIKQQPKFDHQSFIVSLKKQMETISRLSAQKDKEIANLRNNLSQQSQKITILQMQVDNLESLLSKIIKRKDQQYRYYYDQKSNQGLYRSYHFEGEKFQAPKEKDIMSNISQAKLGSSRKVEGYLQSSRIGNLSNSRNSRREQLLHCQNMKDVLNLPEYRNG